MDDELEADPDRAALEQVIGVLTPLRQHRQARAERAQRQLQDELQAMYEQLRLTEQSWVQERDNQKVRRQQLSAAHLQKTMALDDVDRWHDKERRMLDRLAYIRQNANQLRYGIEQQHLRIEQARLEAKARQRAVEKLACMSETLNEE
ncbi:type III secretion protein [Pseudomonas sp. ADAK2]|uniref:type III secretion protein n=1 Tax=unclassified Pseudomonas TaxID=196821 RepID=UPI001462E067|nr:MULTISPECIES: type III secretion protein [unclassified Pseudomonas]QJI41144.1 type III secretion protein [Pseudomonas sp. ADAK7]QJI47449.1 type III secretion protein [Pseudomonas sp. ADAK2]